MRRIVIIAIVAIPLVVLLIGIVSFSMKKGTDTSSGTPAPTVALAPVTPDITSTLPVDAPQGSNIVLQGEGGSVKLKNFYSTAKGYWPAVSALLLEQTPAYSIWYYRSDSSFEIALSSTGTFADASAAEKVLMSDIGVADIKTLCSFAVFVSYPVDQGGSRMTIPLSACASGF